MAQFPKLREDLKITRQVQRDGVHYVIKDPQKQDYYRFPEDEFKVIRLFDGTRSLEQIVKEFNQNNSEMEVDLAVVQEFHGSLNKLHLLEKSLAEQNLFLLESMREQRKSKLMGAKGSLMYFRINLLDPNDLLNAIYPKIKWVFTPKFLGFGALCVLLACWIIFARYDEFLEGIKSITTFSDKSPLALFGLWATVVVVIFFHELGHAFTCKHFGGDVREMGILMLFFTPCFYANVNDAWGFPKRYQKLCVTFAGGLIEFFIGSLATFFWFFLYPGSIASGIAYQVMTICAFSSVMFNFNPLMKLDGYYAFSDFVEIPNLKAESAKYVKYIFQKYLFRVQVEDDTDKYTLREKRILFGYGVCSIIYMTGVMTGLFFMARGLLIDNFKGIGVILSFLVAWKLFKGHFFKLKGFLVKFYSEKLILLKQHPIISGCFLLFIAATSFFALSHRTLHITKECSLIPFSQKKVYATASGFLLNHQIYSGKTVQFGDTLGFLKNFNLEEQIEIAQIKKERETLQKSQALFENNSIQKKQYEANLKQTKNQLKTLEQELDNSFLLSTMAGVILTSEAEKGFQPFFNKGSEIFTLARLDSFYLDLTLLESELGDAKIGDKAELRLPSFPHHLTAGRIFHIAPVSESYNSQKETTGVENKFNVRILVNPEAGLPLYPNLNGTVRIYLGKVKGFQLVWHQFKRVIRPDLFI